MNFLFESGHEAGAMSKAMNEEGHTVFGRINFMQFFPQD
jgi:hypothetical protein